MTKIKRSVEINNYIQFDSDIDGNSGHQDTFYDGKYKNSSIIIFVYYLLSIY